MSGHYTQPQAAGGEGEWWGGGGGGGGPGRTGERELKTDRTEDDDER